MSAEMPVLLANLTTGQRLDGTVKKLTLSGAIIDVGLQADGLLHISDLNQKNVTRVSSVLAEGQQVVVWVKQVDPISRRLSLTMVEPPKYSWNDLVPGVKVEGKVVRLESFGAFVDIGADTHGLVHVSEMGTGRVAKPSDVVAEGEAVTVWVKEADRKARRISLTMQAPPAVDIRTLKPNAIVSGKVVRLESFGAFVDIGAGRDGMVHITEMGQGYVGSPSDILSVGEEVQVRVLEVDPRRGRISLSLKDLPVEQFSADAEEDDLPSSMEIALRSAMGPARDDRRGSNRRERRRSRQQRDQTQDEIISRTLRERPRS